MHVIIRPEYLRLVEPKRAQDSLVSDGRMSLVEGRVQSVVNLGNLYEVYINVREETLRMECQNSRDAVPAPGSMVNLAIPMDYVKVLPS